MMDWQQATCYLNGEWTPLSEARVSVLDRGFIFGDGVYEVIPVDTVEISASRPVRAPFRAREHFERLQRSLDGVRIANPLSPAQWFDLLHEIVERHPWPRQLVYLQITRGVARRDHPFPADAVPTVFVSTGPWPAIAAEQLQNGVAAVTHADERWLHCDIKSTSLLGNVLMKQYAVERGASETVMLRDGFLTEGSSTNVMIVRDQTLIAPPNGSRILPGITVDAVQQIAHANGMPVEVRPVPEAELRAADELFLSSSGREVLAITSLDGAAVGNGFPGPHYRRMQNWFAAAKREDAERWHAQRPARALAA